MQPDVAELLPHSGRALLLDRVISHTPAATRCAVRITADHPYLDGGRVSSLLALEWGAQTTAVHARLAASADASGAPARGYVVGAPRLEFSSAYFEIGDELEITAAPGFVHGALAQYRVSVTRAGATCASGDVNVYVEAGTPGAREALSGAARAPGRGPQNSPGEGEPEARS